MAGALAPLAIAQLPPACAPFSPQCLYTPAVNFQYGTQTVSASYKDLVNDLRTLSLTLRIPVAPINSLPVVIWSPGAGSGASPNTDMTRWSETTARAGFLTVTVSHPLRSRVDRLRLCAELHVKYGYPMKDCAVLDPVNWDWPTDLRKVIDWLEQANISGPTGIRGRINMSRIVVGGFTEGSNGAISLGGATRLLTTTDRRNPNDFSDPRPVAFISLSPKGPRAPDDIFNEGFYDYDLGQRNSSWDNVSRPVLSVTSAGDNTCPTPARCLSGDSPSRRMIAHQLMPPGNKYQMFVRTANMSHDFIGSLDVPACAAAGVQPGLCAQFDEWLRSSVIAFLDWHVRQLPLAQVWLNSDLIEPASNDIVDSQRK